MRTRRLTLTALTILTTLGAGLTLASTPAFATKTRLPLPFSPFGSFIDAKGIAVDQSSGNLYVTDINSTKVQVLGSEGGPPVGGVSSTISGASTPQGSFDFNYLGTFVAVDNACYDKKLSGPACASADPSNGDIYLMDSAGQGGRAVVDKFTLNSSGEFEYVCQFIGYTAAGGDECLKNTSGKEVEFEDVRTATVDEEGNVYIVVNGNVYEFSSTGVPVAAITSSLVPEPNTVAVDSVGNIYIAHQSTGLLVELKRASFTAGTVESEVELANGVVRVALDQATGHLLSIGVGSPLVSEYNQNGELQLQFSLTRSEANKDIAVNEASDFVYVTSENAVEAFGPPVNPVVVTTEGVSNVTAVSATVNGSLDPQGQEAGARFEYGTSPALGSNVVTSPAHVSGESSVPVSANLTHLEPHLTYYYRLAGTDTDSTFYGAVESFTTVAIEPLVDVQPPLFVGQHEATVMAGVNPENSDTHYHFLFGTTASYGTILPAEEVDLGSSYGIRRVALPVEGLAPGTTYHYAVVASNSQGTVQSADMTFTTPTLALLMPTVFTGLASDVSPNGAVISGTVDPRGLPTSYEFDIGTDTTYGSRVFGEAGSGVQASTFTLGLQGLAAGTLYHYRLVAIGRYGTVYGADETFATPGFPTALLVSPVGAPLVPAPAFTPPSTGGAVTVKLVVKHKAKRKAKQKRKTGKRGARKAGKASRRHGNRRSGR